MRVPWPGARMSARRDRRSSNDGERMEAILENLDLFADLLPKNAPRLVRMTIAGTTEDTRGRVLYRMRCERCSAVTGWLSIPVEALGKNDMPCLACNGETEADGES